MVWNTLFTARTEKVWSRLIIAVSQVFSDLFLFLTEYY